MGIYTWKHKNLVQTSADTKSSSKTCCIVSHQTASKFMEKNIKISEKKEKKPRQLRNKHTIFLLFCGNNAHWTKRNLYI